MGVFVIYDGIENICTKTDESIIEYMGKYDKKYKINSDRKLKN